MITVASIFRDSAGYVDRYMDQVNRLEKLLQEPVRLVIAEGDSADNTHNLLYEALRARGGGDDTLLKIDHGGPRYGSVDRPERWAQISYVCNAVMDAIEHDIGPVIYVESDLIWQPAVMRQLLADLATYDAVAPMSMFQGRFYDIWGHRGLDGERFHMQAPYHKSLDGNEGQMVEISSAGSCIAMKDEVAKVARFGPDSIVGLSRSIREHGYSLWLDPKVSVIHP